MGSTPISKPRRRQGRGATSNQSFAEESNVLRPRYELLISPENSSTLKSIKRARNVFDEFVKIHNVKDIILTFYSKSIGDLL